MDNPIAVTTGESDPAPKHISHAFAVPGANVRNAMAGMRLRIVVFMAWFFIV
jgi:hypothetical protein